MKTPLVSILVPIYNSSPYLAKCLSSLEAQTFESVEFIFLDDCSTDNSFEILTTFVENHNKIKNAAKIVQNTENKGIAFCRKELIKKAIGDFVLFVDSDDWIDNNMIEELCNKQIDTKADIVVCNIAYETNEAISIANDHVAATRLENVMNAIEQKIAYTSLCNKLIKRELYLIPECEFVENLNYAEDRLVLIKLYFFAKKIEKIEKPLYHYNRCNTSSITSSKTEFHIQNTIFFWKLLDKFLADKNIYSRLLNTIEYSKTESKVGFLIQSDSIELKKKYSYLFRDIELRHIAQFRIGEKIVLWLTHYKFFLLADVVRRLLWWKNGKKS